MFAIIGENVFVAPQSMTKGHLAWFKQSGWVKGLNDTAFAEIVRGHHDKGELYAYRGREFIGDEKVEAAIRKHFTTLSLQLKMAEDVQVFIGPTSANPNSKRPGTREITGLTQPHFS